MGICRKPAFGLIISAATALLLSCGGNNSTGPGNGPSGPSGSAPWALEEYKCTDDGAISDGLNRAEDGLGLPNAIVIKYNGGSSATVNFPSALDGMISYNVDGGHVTIGTPETRNPTSFNIVASGTTENGSLSVYGTVVFEGLYLNGASITNQRGPAVNIQIPNRTGRNLSVHLVGGCGRENYLSDGPFYESSDPKEQLKGTFFSETRVTFTGSGHLEARAKGIRSNGNHAHAIVVDSDMWIESGSITIRESVNDGIHTNDNITITGGTIQIISTGDAIQSEKMGKTIHISGGNVRLRTTGIKSHGIASEDTTVIDGTADVKIHTSGNGAKGIRTRGFMAMRGGTLDITVTGTRHIDNSVIPPDSSNASGIKVGNDIDNHPGNGDMEITGGTLTVNARSALNGRGLNIDGHLNVTGGNTNLTADNDAVRTRGNFRMTGGTLRARSTAGQDIDCRGTYTQSGGSLDAPNRREGI